MFALKSPKQKIAKMVHGNIGAYTETAEKAINGEDITEISFADVRDITVWNDKQVDFLCNSMGLALLQAITAFIIRLTMFYAHFRVKKLLLLNMRMA